MSKLNYTLLLRSFEGKLSPDEAAILEQALRSEPELRKEKERLIRIRSLLERQDFDFAPFFETRVMAGIEVSVELFSEKLLIMFRRMALASVVIIAALMVGIYLQNGDLSINTIAGLSDLGSGNAESLLLYGWDK